MKKTDKYYPLFRAKPTPPADPEPEMPDFANAPSKTSFEDFNGDGDEDGAVGSISSPEEEF
eukprot:5486262-Alexandrium_andersonii.AAC.1